MHHIVFLDRDSLQATVRPPAFAHTWTDYRATLPGDVAERLATATIAVTNKVALDAATLARLPHLTMVAIAATGSDQVDLAACKAKGIVVSNIRNYGLDSVPEHVFTLLLALRRNLRAYITDTENGLWERSSRFCLLDHPIADLAGSRLGIIGYGALGQKVAAIGRAFGMQIATCSRSPVHDSNVAVLPLESLLASSDVVSLHVPLTEHTRNLIGAAQLHLMKRTALLINTARGGIVDEAALAQALRDGVIAGAGVDVLSKEPPPADNPLLQLRLPGFILTPHVAWASAGAMQTLADRLVDNIDAFAAGKPLNML